MSRWSRESLKPVSLSYDLYSVNAAVIPDPTEPGGWRSLNADGSATLIRKRYGRNGHPESNTIDYSDQEPLLKIATAADFVSI